MNPLPLPLGYTRVAISGFEPELGEFLRLSPLHWARRLLRVGVYRRLVLFAPLSRLPVGLALPVFHWKPFSGSAFKAKNPNGSRKLVGEGRLELPKPPLLRRQGVPNSQLGHSPVVLQRRIGRLFAPYQRAVLPLNYWSMEPTRELEARSAAYKAAASPSMLCRPIGACAVT